MKWEKISKFLLISYKNKKSLFLSFIKKALYLIDIYIYNYIETRIIIKLRN